MEARLLLRVESSVIHQWEVCLSILEAFFGPKLQWQFLPLCTVMKTIKSRTLFQIWEDPLHDHPLHTVLSANLHIASVQASWHDLAEGSCFVMQSLHLEAASGLWKLPGSWKMLGYIASLGSWKLLHTECRTPSPLELEVFWVTFPLGMLLSCLGYDLSLVRGLFSWYFWLRAGWLVVHVIKLGLSHKKLQQRVLRIQ